MVTEEDVLGWISLEDAMLAVEGSSEFAMRFFEALLEDEGVRDKKYRDTEGVWTIGVGHTGPEVDALAEEEKASIESIVHWLLRDVRKAYDGAVRVIPNLDQYSSPRKAVVVMMVFNLGETGFRKFRKTIQYLKTYQWVRAGFEMLDSKWATQVGKRAYRLSKQMALDEWQ